jgi:hypothetical protein
MLTWPALLLLPLLLLPLLLLPLLLLLATHVWAVKGPPGYGPGLLGWRVLCAWC